MRWLTIAVALTALALLGAGCGGGDDSNTATDTDTTEITDTAGTDDTTTDETTTDTDTDTDTNTDVTGIASEECLEALGASSAFAEALANAATDSESLEDSSQLFQEFADNAPDEVREDFQTVAEAYSAYIDVVAGIDLQAGETPSAEQLAELQAATQSFSDPDVAAASERITAWGEENCPSG